MNKQHSLRYNGMMNLIYTGSRILFPLLTAPYLARVLGPESTGRVDFIISIANYFVLLASLGIPTYGIRVCAAAARDKNLLSQSVRELLFINILAMIFSMALYFSCVFFVPKLNSDYRLAVLIALLIPLRTLSIDWFYQGIEQYDYITFRTLLVRLISLLFIFLAIHSPENYMQYGVSCILMDAGASICNLWNLRRYVNLRGAFHCEFKRHLKPIFIFFLSSLAISIYNQMDVTMIGFLRGAAETGYYEYGVKPIKIAWTVLIGLTSVAMPRIVLFIEQKDHEREVALQQKGAQGIFLLALPITAYLFSISYELIIFLFGDGYKISASVFRIFVFAIIPVGFSNYLANMILLPHGFENKRAWSVNIGLAVNLVLNMAFIPRFGACGAAIATLCTEISVCVCLFYSASGYLKNAFQHFDWPKKGVLILGSFILAANISKISFSSLLMKILISGILFLSGYICLLWIIREPLFLEQINNKRKNID